MVEVEVRTLTSGVVQRIHVADDWTIKEVKQLLKNKDERFKGCKLLYNQGEVGDDTTVGSLNITPGTFLTAFLRKAKRREAAAPAQPIAGAEEVHGPVPSSPPRGAPAPPVLPASPNQLDTLLPGYLSRPMRSPVKAANNQTRPLAPPGDNISTLFEIAPPAPTESEKLSCRALNSWTTQHAASASSKITGFMQTLESLNLNLQENPPPDQEERAPVQQPPQQFSLQQAPTLPYDDTIAQFPLPPSIYQLEDAYRHLCAVHDFLDQTHIQSTWQNVSQALHISTVGPSVTLKDVYAMALVCPEVVKVVPVTPAAGWGDEADVWRRVSLPLAHDHILGSLGEGISGSSGSEPHSECILVVKDPCFTHPRPPKVFMEAVQAKRSLVEKAGQGNNDKNLSSDVVEDAAEGVKPGSSKQRAPRVNKQMRQAWAFRRAAVEVLAFLQNIVFGGNGRAPPVLPPLLPVKKAKKAPEMRRRSRQGKEKLAAAEAAANNVVDLSSEIEKPQEATADLKELLSSGTWHPAYRLGKISLDVFLAAAVMLVDAKTNNMQQQSPATATAREINEVIEDEPASKRLRTAINTTVTVNSKKHPPCRDTSKLNPPGLLAHLKARPTYIDQVVHIETIPGREATSISLEPPLSPAAAAALSSRGINTLFSHQAAAISALRAGQHTVVATSTASGKSVCYTVPILEALEADPRACALLIYPTKALAQDQLKSLVSFARSAFGSEETSHFNPDSIAIYDGDTPMADRGNIRDNVQILITNPDMLHLSILPVHSQFSRLLSNLKYVVIDEAHMYRGVFGAHTALVIRRLKRICSRVYNANPVFAATTATVANPREHALRLLGVSEVTLFENDGSPHGRKQFVLWNPALRDPEGAARLTQQQKQQANLQSPQLGTTSRRAAQEAQREAVRAAQQARMSGARLGGEGYSEQDWEAEVSVGQRVEAVKHTSPSKQPGSISVSEQPTATTAKQQLTARQKRLAADALAAISSIVTTSASGAASPAKRNEPEASRTRKLLKVGPFPEKGSSSRGGGGGEQYSGESMLALQAQLPQGIASKTRVGSAGVPEELRRASPIVEISLLLAECCQHGLRTIAFCHTRKLCELVASYCREMLATSAPALQGKVAVYRAGYSPAERREIEGALVSGELLGVAATNALELGIDVGGLDATLHLGFPGSIASLWQQAGRAGRREQDSLSIYIGWDGPLDQYFFSNPAALFSRPIEAAMVDPCNPAALRAHLACAALEAPLIAALDTEVFGASAYTAAVSDLLGNDLIGRHPAAPGQLHYIGAANNPAKKISLRAIDPEKYQIVDESANNAVLEEIEESKAFFSVYDGAVYMAQGRTYLCKKLDLNAKVAIVRPASLKYYTVTLDFTEVHVVGGNNAFISDGGSGGECSRPVGEEPSRGGALQQALEHQQSQPPLMEGTSAVSSDALVTTRWLGFSRIRRYTGEVFDSVDLFLPDVQYATEATFLRLPPSARRSVEEQGIPFRDSVHGAAHAVLNVLPLFVICNPEDVGAECDNPYDSRYKPERILIYDKYPGGIGLAAAARPKFTEILRRALALVSECSCNRGAGCPGCVHHLKCSEYNAVLHKEGAKLVLQAALQAELEKYGGAVEGAGGMASL